MGGSCLVLNYMNVFKHNLRSSDTKLQNWEQSAMDHTAWRQIVHAGVSASDAKRIEAFQDKRQGEKTLNSLLERMLQSIDA